jgi:hypothetical protein
MECPHCQKKIPPKLIAAAMGARGGKAGGDRKKRTPEQLKNAIAASVATRQAKARERKALLAEARKARR